MAFLGVFSLQNGDIFHAKIFFGMNTSLRAVVNPALSQSLQPEHRGQF
jgi:hypothetical protein